MIRRLPSFTLFPYTTLFRSLMAVVLDGETVLHEIDDPALLAHVDRAATLFREKTLKREYFATLPEGGKARAGDRKSTRLNSSHGYISYDVFCLKKKTKARKG